METTTTDLTDRMAAEAARRPRGVDGDALYGRPSRLRSVALSDLNGAAMDPGVRLAAAIDYANGEGPHPDHVTGPVTFPEAATPEHTHPDDEAAATLSQLRDGWASLAESDRLTIRFLWPALGLILGSER